MDPEQIIKEGVEKVVSAIPSSAFKYGVRSLTNKICTAVYYDEAKKGEVSAKDKTKELILKFVEDILNSPNDTQEQDKNEDLFATIKEKLTGQSNAIFKDSYLNAYILERLLNDRENIVADTLNEIVQQTNEEKTDEENVDETLMNAIESVSNNSTQSQGGRAIKRINRTRKYKQQKRNKTKKRRK
jgi:H2-forming N5,N10-methylenetetrahydromethanopterin dehydrogenase-like enzyme